MDLFASPTEGEPIELADAQLVFFRQIIFPYSHTQLLAALIAQVPWAEEAIILYGKRCIQPRLIAWYGDAGMNYRYSGVTHRPLAWTPLLLSIKSAVQTLCGHEFNSALVNYYRNERDSMGMHSDDEAELGAQPVIASLSLGAERTFILQHKSSGARYKLALPGGSVLVMKRDTQHYWRHGINKEHFPCGPRINITFRRIIPL